LSVFCEAEKKPHLANLFETRKPRPFDRRRGGEVETDASARSPNLTPALRDVEPLDHKS